MHSKLLRDAETDVTAHRHELCACRMRNVPIHPDPDVHSGTQADVSCDSSQQNIAAAPVLTDARNAIILGMQPCQRGTDEPLPRHVLRLIWTIRKPETRFDVAAEPRLLGTL